MSGRASVVIISLHVGLWILMFVHYAFGLVALFTLLISVIPIVMSRCEATSPIFGPTSQIFLPITRGELLHNREANLHRRCKKAQELTRKCERLMRDFEDDPMRHSVLEAERDTAQREHRRLADDLQRFQVLRRLEEKERSFKQLTGGRS